MMARMWGMEVSRERRISPHPGQDGSKKARSSWRQVRHSGASTGGWDTGCALRHEYSASAKH